MTDLPMSGAKRQAEYMKREILKRKTPAEKQSWLAKRREQSMMSKRRERARKKLKGMIAGQTEQMTTVTTTPVAPTSMKETCMTANAIRQRRFREKRKAEKEVARAALWAAANLVTEEPNCHIKWNNTNKQKRAAEPEYLTGKLAVCPNQLEGNDAMAAIVLEGLSDYLQKKWKEPEIQDLLLLAYSATPKTTGIRKISGGRYEFFVQVKDCTPAAFKTILRQSEKGRRGEPDLDLTDNDLCMLIGLIVGLARRTANDLVPTGYAFQNFAYIVSFGGQIQQDVHIDLNNPKHYQLGMLCSRSGELTWEYKCGDKDFVVEQGAKLEQFWGDMPRGLQEKLDKIPVIQALLNGFGPLLSPKIKRVKKRGTKSAEVVFGTVLRLPGRVMHCGPAVTHTSKLRAVLFFTATPIAEPAYDSETQYCRSTLIHDILLHSWSSLSSKEREYMLTKWTDVGLRYDSMDAVDGNMNHKHLIVIARALKKTKKGKETELIDRIANDSRWSEENYIESMWDDRYSKEYDIPLR